ncbi:D-arabinose 1-dehydrogenase, Zn-dependent alcohol dehydrogenase family [Nocardioides exalbidus]|uniref:alcohol dehydrogenase n=1 Tax=Nocardioides exalbidus TaxID=402596 RepID=A0A1H4Q1F5_9ACTN|nr:zinc-binding dehydrogenase [Nocardioides exalbidus]SEC13272.1 D-arabinose 1-dehydrogenase, Zn-dependent alcohol dehydrogenase family [Nocardioides exalbidus]
MTSTATTMRAQRLDTTTLTFEITDVPVPAPGPGQVLIEVAFSGICHSDLSLLDGTFPAMGPEVITQGHEASGVIAALGPGVEGWALGDRVVPAAGRPCRQCPMCRRGELGRCLALQLMAFAYDGAWAQYTVADAQGLTRIPDNVSMEHAAVLADAVATPYGAVVHTAELRVGESAGVWGVGGVGTHIVQLARLVGATPIVAVDLDPAARQRALDLGADLALDPHDAQLVSKVREATGGIGLDAAFDAVGIKATFDQALEALGNGGRLVGVGMSADELSLGMSVLFNLSRKQVRGHLGYEVTDVGVLARLVSTGRLDLSRSISQVVALEDLEEGIRTLRSGEGSPVRILVQP